MGGSAICRTPVPEWGEGACLTSQTTSPRLTPKFVEAMQYAAEKHATQTRKASDIPYLGHLLSVAGLVIEADGTETQAIAALLHDAAEDQGGEETLAEIREKFGDDVAAIVGECSDTFETPKPPSRQRKESYIRHLAEASDGRHPGLAGRQIAQRPRNPARLPRALATSCGTRSSVQDPAAAPLVLPLAARRVQPSASTTGWSTSFAT